MLWFFFVCVSRKLFLFSLFFLFDRTINPRFLFQMHNTFSNFLFSIQRHSRSHKHFNPLKIKSKEILFCTKFYFCKPFYLNIIKGSKKSAGPFLYTMFRLQTPTFNWPKQEFCTLYIFYYKETENIYPYYVSSNPVVLSAFWYISPSSAVLPPSILFPLSLLFFVYTDVYTHPPRTLILSLVRSRSPRHITQKIGMKRTKKKRKEKKTERFLFRIWTRTQLSSRTHGSWCSPFQMLCWAKKKESSVSFSSRDIFFVFFVHRQW